MTNLFVDSKAPFMYKITSIITLMGIFAGTMGALVSISGVGNATGIPVEVPIYFRFILFLGIAIISVISYVAYRMSSKKYRIGFISLVLYSAIIRILMDIVVLKNFNMVTTDLVIYLPPFLFYAWYFYFKKNVVEYIKILV